MVNALAPLAKTPRGPRFIIAVTYRRLSMNPTGRLALVLGLAIALSTTACMDPDNPGNLVPATVK